MALRRNDVYVLDMSLLTLNGACFFAKASKSVNWLWHKRLSHLNFKNINKLAKQNKVLGLPSLVYSKDKPCSACEKGKHHRASFKTKQNFSIRKCLHLLDMDLFRPVSPMSINHEKYTLVIVDEYSRMVENQNNVKVKHIRIDNGTEFRNSELENFFDGQEISQNFSSPYTHKQNGVAKRKNRTLIEAARTMLNGSVLSKHLWTKAVRIACYSQRSIIVKRHDKTPYEIFRERNPDISYFYVFGCVMFIHNYKDDGYFQGYSFVSKSFRVFNTRRQQIETYHVTFDESMEAIKFTNTLVDEIRIDDSSRYPPDEFLHEDDPFRKYQANSDISYYIIPHGRSLTELTKDTHVHEVITLNEQNTPHTKNVACPPDLTNTKGIQEQESQITHDASTSSHHAPQDRWSRDQHIELVNIIGEPTKGMLTRSMAAKLIAASARTRRMNLELSLETKQDWLHKVIVRKKELTMMKHFAPVARMEAIRILLAFATYMNFKVFHMDVKSAFLNGKFKNKFIENNLLVLKVVNSLTTSFLSKKTPMVPPNNLGPDLAGKLVNETMYRGMIGSLMYLTATRPDIQFSTFLCARYQANLKESYLIVVKRIFKCLEGTLSLGLWYPKCSGFDLKGYLDSDYAICNMDKKSTSGACQLLGGKLVCYNTKKQQSVAMSTDEAEYVVVVRCCANIL
ncbi:retrovirus-related pol polyprotein from transposon TNT 1-94 [Tanacetum coccineum]